MSESFVSLLLASEAFQKYAKLLPTNSEHFHNCERSQDGCCCLEELWHIADKVLPVKPSVWIGGEPGRIANNAVHEAFRLINQRKVQQPRRCVRCQTRKVGKQDIYGGMFVCKPCANAWVSKKVQQPTSK